MLGKLFELTAGAVKETYNGVASIAEYTIDEITSIPDAIEKGWDEGLLSKGEDAQSGQPTTKTESPFAKPTV